MNKSALVKNKPSGFIQDEYSYSHHLDRKDNLLLLKRGIWLYFLLLLFEGALRKWFLPDLAAPLLIIRDPLALGLIILCWKQGLLPRNIYLGGMVTIGIIGVYTALFFGHGSLPVALFGARILIIQFPLIFVVGRVFNCEDVVKIGKFTLCISIPMAVLIGLQFYSPQSSWVNRGIGGDLEGAGFSGSMGYFRPSGTFSFTNGNTLFFGFVACYLIYFWLNPRNINKWILIAASASLLASIPLSISRGLFFQVVISLLFATLASIRNPKYVGRILFAGIGVFLSLIILSQITFFQMATGAFTARFEGANTSEGGLEGVFFDRYLGGLLGAFLESSDLPFFGYGIGMGTNVGSQILTGGRQFLISEGEWGRLIGEMGILLGIISIIFRLSLTAKIISASYLRLVNGSMLPWMLLSFGLFVFPQGQWAQPTSLGFGILIGGLMIASFRDQSVEGKKENGEKAEG